MFSVRRRWDPQPTSPAVVLLASAGAPFSKSAVRRARELAAGEPIAVLTILTIYGSAFGLPNPGLLPTRGERDEQFANVQRAIKQLERAGCAADGQVAATRSAARMIAKVAGTRQVRYVVMDERGESGLRGLRDHGVISTVRRRLGGRAVLELVKPATG
jgi:Universal stress protein family